jgi:subtilase family serine protease
MNRASRLSAFSLMVLVAVPGLALGLSAQTQDSHGAGPRRALITQQIDETNRFMLKGNLRPEANALNDRGLAAEDLPMEHMLLQLQRSPEREQSLAQFESELYDPQSSNFHHWLTAEEFGSRFGVAPADRQKITGWLEAHGFVVNSLYPNGMLVDFSGTAGQVREAFQTEIHNLEVKGQKHIANMSEPQIPIALAPAIAGVVSLHDFMPHPMHRAVMQPHISPTGTLVAAGESTGPHPEYTVGSGSSSYDAVVPADLATIYNLNPLFAAGYTGKGQTVVVIEDTNVFSTADWTTFRSVFGLSHYTTGTFTTVHPAPKSGTNNCANPGVNGDESEAILDAEWASATAPGATIEMASCADTTSFGGLIAFQNIINASATPPAVISISYGECETLNGAAGNAAYNAAYQQAAAEGVSVFVSSGDEGASSCDANSSKATHGIGVSGLASTAYNVAVGGTDFGDTYAVTNSTYWNPTNTATYGSAKSYVPEIPWNDSCAGVLLATYATHSGVTYGSKGFCNTNVGAGFLTTASGSGGASSCATGAASTSGVVSGTCKGYAKPSWQSLVGVPNNGVRNIPDVSLFAANGVWGHYFVYCWSDTHNGGHACTSAPSGWSGAGGTSFSSPIMAGIQALVNQKHGRQGDPNPVYYKLAAAEYGATGSAACNSSKGNGVASTCIFHDVTLGDMDVNCTGTHNCYLPSGANGVLSTSGTSYSKAYGTTTGWDFATGIGTVNANNLVNKW